MTIMSLETSLNFHFRNPTTSGNLEAELLFYLPEGNNKYYKKNSPCEEVPFVDLQQMFMVR